MSSPAPQSIDMAPLVGAASASHIGVTFFSDEFAKTLRTQDMTLPELRDRILKTTAARKGDLPWLKLATFGDNFSSQGSLRHNDNVLAISGIEADYDGQIIAFEAAVEIIRAAKLRALLYTSPSHTPMKPRWRALLPCSHVMPPTPRVRLVSRLNGLFDGALAPESFTLSQAYFFGSVGTNPHHCAELVVGYCIDLRDDLDAGAIGKWRTANGGSARGTVDDKTLIENILSGADYHNSLTALAARLVGRGMAAEDAQEYLRSAMDQSAGPRDARWHKRYCDIRRTVASAVRKYQK